jgi:hypothetical protein
MTHRTRIRPNFAAWSLGSAVLQSEYDAFDAAQFSSPDFDAGGIWLPSGKIIIGGTSGLDVTAPFRSLGPSCYSASLQAQNWPERASVGASTPVNSDIALAWGPTNGVGSGSLLVAQSADPFLYSAEDGALWTSRGAQTNAKTTNPSIAFGLFGATPGFLFTWTASTGFFTTTDGITVNSTVTTVPANGVAAYSASLGMWVIAGDAGVIYTSPTAAAGTWTLRTTPAGWIAGCGGVKRVVFGGGLWVILPLASYGKCLTSPDGITWTERSLPATSTWTGLAYSATDALWMAVATSGGSATAISSDGITWAYAVSATGVGMSDLACINSTWVAPINGGSFGGITWTVDKGSTWQRIAVGNHRVATGGWKRILAADNRFIVSHITGAAVEFAMSVRSS